MSRSALLHFLEKLAAFGYQAFGSCAEGIAGLQYFESLPIQLEDDGAVSATSLVNFKSVTLGVTSNV